MLRPSRKQDTPTKRSNTDESKSRRKVRNRIKKSQGCQPALLGLITVAFLLAGWAELSGLGGGNKKTSVRWDDPGHSTTKGLVARTALFPAAPEFDTDGKTRLHVVFSTDCGDFQHWQSYLLFFSAMKVGQPGRVTRIASGCTDEESAAATAWHEEHVTKGMSDKFGLHLTPHFSSVTKDGKEVGNYKFFNKPHGLKHWLEHGEGMGVDPATGKLLDEDLVVILTDPDMLFLRPIGADFSNKEEYLFFPRKDNEKQKYRVEHGSPFAQRYGYGGVWQKSDLTKISGEGSPAISVTPEEARFYYPAGPPYIATGRDMYSIAQKWSEFVPLVHAQRPELLAEMYAYSIAAAHLELPHQLIDSLMLTQAKAKIEASEFIDKIPAAGVCEFAAHPDSTKYTLPNVVHFCQRYFVGEWFFSKRRTPKDFFTCESPLFEIPPSDLGENFHYQIPPGNKHNEEDPKEKISPQMAKREAFIICALVSGMNEAATFFKKNHCDGIEGTRTDKSLNLFSTF
mmetsp:Transcript_23714/g.34577  ORF Transcript_23714/g.34577 Transcript_23714/m.34577 type:complete len:511 (+) Transcript_23714:55-1587(+)